MPDANGAELPGRCDVVVVGAGLAGLVAAVAAAEAGARVAVFEKQPDLGGTVVLASGHLWHSFPLREDVDGIDAEISGLVSSDFEAGAIWLRDRGVVMTESGARTHGYQIQPNPTAGLIEPLLERLGALRGRVVPNTPVTGLERNSGGVVTGVHLEGRARTVRAGAVVLATGGFQGDQQLVSKYIAPAERMLWRSNPGATGDGLRMAVAAGAGLSAGMHSFYGHLSPHDGRKPVQVEPMVYRRATLGCIEHVTLLNLAGQRFIDETRPDVAVAQALAQDDRAVGVVVFDDSVHQRYVTQRNALPKDARSALILWQAVGGRVDRAETLTDLLSGLSDVGLDAPAAIATMRAYDHAAATGTDQSLPVPRPANLHRCVTPPFYAMLVCPDLTFTDGGLRVNATCQVLDTQGRPIDRLFAVGETAGLVSVASQAGGIATAVTTGLRAGPHSARAATKEVREMEH